MPWVLLPKTRLSLMTNLALFSYTSISVPVDVHFVIVCEPLLTRTLRQIYRLEAMARVAKDGEGERERVLGLIRDLREDGRAADRGGRHTAASRS